MKVSGKHIITAVIIAVILALGIYMQNVITCSLAFREQVQMFLFTADYAKDILPAAGGVAVYVSRFLVQFFCIGGMGTVITTLLLLIMTLLTWGILSRAGAPWYALPLAFLPALFLTVSLFDYSFLYQGVVSYLFAVAFLYVYSVTWKDNTWLRLVCGTLMTIVLYIMAGAVAFLFAVCACLYDLMRTGISRNASWTFIALSILLGAYSVFTGGQGSFAYVLTPEVYTDFSMPFHSIHYVSWAVMPLSMLIVWALRRLHIRSVTAVSLLCVVMAGSAATAFAVSCKRNYQESYERIAQLNGYINRHEWNTAVEKFGSDCRNFMEANYVNMALAEQGKLADHLLEYNQNGPLALIFYPKEKEYIEMVTSAQVLFAMGNVAASQSMSSNADQAKCGHNPSMLKLMTQAELVRGNYAVAEKYLDLLSRTLFYASWAHSQRRFLHNDKLVMADPVLSTARRDMPVKEDFVLYNTPMDDMYNILDANGSDRKAMEYALSYLILSKDVNSVQDFIDRYYGKPALRTLPVCAQEALIFCSDYYGGMKREFAMEHGMSGEEFDKFRKVDRAYCLGHGVTPETMRHYDEFKQEFSQSGQNPAMLARYAGTFWYYLYFVQI